MINKPHSVALRLTPEEYSAIVHLQLLNGHKNLAVTLRQAIEPLIVEGMTSLKAVQKKEEARLKRIAKKEAASVVHG